MAKDYYLILGISSNASREDIKAAFRRRALELHPDRSGLGSGPFQELQEAYSVLVDPERRRLYDREQAPAAASRPTPVFAAEPLVSRRPRAEPLRRPHSATGFRELSLSELFEILFREQ